jgi:hypothetical protein
LYVISNRLRKVLLYVPSRTKSLWKPDALRLFFILPAGQKRPDDIQAESVLTLLDRIESKHSNAAVTRNWRLAPAQRPGNQPASWQTRSRGYIAGGVHNRVDLVTLVHCGERETGRGRWSTRRQ